MPPRILRWALYSPARLVAVALAVAGIVVGGVVLAGTQTVAPTQRAQPTPRPEPVARVSRPTATSGEVSPPTERVPSSVRTGLVRAARAFVEAWARDAQPDPRASWLSALRPMTTPSLYRGLRATDPARLPRAHVRRVDLEQAGPFAGAAVVTLDDGMRVDVRLVAGQGGWLVADIRPAGS